jgi:hypothetical protein
LVEYVKSRLPCCGGHGGGLFDQFVRPPPPPEWRPAAQGSAFVGMCARVFVCGKVDTLMAAFSLWEAADLREKRRMKDSGGGWWGVVGCILDEVIIHKTSLGEPSGSE